MSIIKKLSEHGFLSTPYPFVANVNYEVIMGSTAYGANMDDGRSDMDMVGVVVPPIEMVFPWVTGWIPGFGGAFENFEIFQQHHINAFERKYDVNVYSIIKFFQLAVENNPNVLDVLWVPDHCVSSIDEIGKVIRKNRKHFLHKGAYHRFRGYAHQQFKRLENSPRKDLVEKYGYDTKFAYHIVRLCLQCEQILSNHDMDLGANAAYLKAIRTGAMRDVSELRAWYMSKESELDKLYVSSSLQHSPDMQFLKALLMTILEIKYGGLAKVYDNMDNGAMRKLEAIRQIINS